VFVRFVVKQRDPNSGRRQGLFQAAGNLRDSGTLSARDAADLKNIRDWFNENLRRPTRLAVSPRPHRKAQAISWFKDTAIQHIAKMREFQQVLERYGLDVDVITAHRLGYILFEDEFQVAAYPFRDTPT
jgi:hypothetical protein